MSAWMMLALAWVMPNAATMPASHATVARAFFRFEIWKRRGIEEVCR
jgi:hypothetical protein